QWAEQLAKRNETSGRKPATRAVLDSKRPSSANALFATEDPQAQDDSLIRLTRPGEERTVPASDSTLTKPKPAAKTESARPLPAETEADAEPAQPKLPVLQGVSANAGIELRDPGTKDGRAAMNSPESAHEASATLKELMDRWLSQSGDNSFRQQ